MTRQPKNEAFARTSFLQGANATYIEEMQAQYERNPGSVSDLRCVPCPVGAAYHDRPGARGQHATNRRPVGTADLRRLRPL